IQSKGIEEAEQVRRPQLVGQLRLRRTPGVSEASHVRRVDAKRGGQDRRHLLERLSARTTSVQEDHGRPAPLHFVVDVEISDFLEHGGSSRYWLSLAAAFA